MIYLDYADSTWMSYEALDSYNKGAREFGSSLMAFNNLGVKANQMYYKILLNVAALFDVEPGEISFTCGENEANNLALIGTMMASKTGKHLILSKLESATMTKIGVYLTKLGYEISYVNNDEEGLIDFNHLRSLIRKDTVLVSITALNNEMGLRQPLKLIRQTIKKVNPTTLLHSDYTNAIGKISCNLHDVDLATVSACQIFGPAAIGFFYHRANVQIEPLMYGAGVDPITPRNYSLPDLLAFERVLISAVQNLEKKEHFVARLNDKVCSALSKYENIIINKTKYSVPYLLSLSFLKTDVSLIQTRLEAREIYVKVLNQTLNPTVLAVYNDKERAQATMRLSFSSKTTTDEINRFLNDFRSIYDALLTRSSNVEIDHH